MALVDAWTGRIACALQAALRLTNEAFANRLGVAVRTVANWHERPDMTPRTEMQQALDTVLEQAPKAVRDLVAAKAASIPVQRTTADQPHSGYTLTVAVAIVVKAANVLLVQRRGEDGGGISWQFPAGMVKPGVAPELVAVRETLGETDIHCQVVRSLGSRLHPITNVYCDYLLCDYLTGDAHNVDPVENVSVTWAPTDALTRFIPAERIFLPILEALEASGE